MRLLLQKVFTQHMMASTPLVVEASISEIRPSAYLLSKCMGSIGTSQLSTLLTTASKLEHMPPAAAAAVSGFAPPEPWYGTVEQEQVCWRVVSMVAPTLCNAQSGLFVLLLRQCVHTPHYLFQARMRN